MDNTDVVVDPEAAVILAFSVTDSVWMANKGASVLQQRRSSFNLGSSFVPVCFSTILSSGNVSLTSLKFGALFAEPLDVTCSPLLLSCQDNSQMEILRSYQAHQILVHRLQCDSVREHCRHTCCHNILHTRQQTALKAVCMVSVSAKQLFTA